MSVRSTLTLLIIALALFLLTGCMRVSFMEDNLSYLVDTEGLRAESFLERGEEPQVIFSSDVENDKERLETKGSVLFASSRYSAPESSGTEDEAKALAKRIGARTVLYGYLFSEDPHGVEDDFFGLIAPDSEWMDHIVFFFI